MGSHASPPIATLAGPPDDVRAVVNALRRIVRALRLTARAGERAAGISAAQLFVLQRLAERPARSIAELAERTLTDASSASVAVQRLVERGFVTRSQSRLDARRSELALSGRGRALLGKLPPAAQARLIEAVAALPGLERRSLARSLGRLAADLGVADEPASLFFEDEPTHLSTRPARR